MFLLHSIIEIIPDKRLEEITLENQLTIGEKLTS